VDVYHTSTHGVALVKYDTAVSTDRWQNRQS